MDGLNVLPGAVDHVIVDICHCIDKHNTFTYVKLHNHCVGCNSRFC